MSRLPVSRRQIVTISTIVAALLFAALLPPTTARAGKKSATNAVAAPIPTDTAYRNIVLNDGPVAYWSFQGNIKKSIANVAPATAQNMPLSGAYGKKGLPVASGPSKAMFPLFDGDDQTTAKNSGIEFQEGLGWVRIADPGEKSLLDFDNGDAMTLEVWVKPSRLIRSNAYAYLIGKGRTQTSGKNSLNQNYGLRLITSGGPIDSRTARLSFLFRSRGKKGDWHRWTSKKSFSMTDGWHHIVFTYKFGAPKSIAAYIDGEPTKGSWDKAGATTQPPVVSDDDVWLGTAMEQNPASSFVGAMDEVAIYRRTLTPQQVKSHFKIKIPELTADWHDVTDDAVQVHIFENIHNQLSWKFRTANLTDAFQMKRFAFPSIAEKYNERGILVDRSNPFLMQALAYVRIPEGKHKLLVRARNASRLFIDGKQVAKTGFHKISGSAHGKVFDDDKSFAPHVRLLHRGDQQAVYEIEGDGQRHAFRFEMIVGGRNHRPDFGETSISIAKANSKDDFVILSPQDGESISLTDASWREFRKQHRREMTAYNAQRRRIASANEDLKWKQRHQLARRILRESTAPIVPQPTKGMRSGNDIDHFINAVLAEKKLKQSQPLSDLAFLRKLALDTQGTVPSLSQVKTFLSDETPQRRDNAIDRFLNEPGWADHWVGYWQDVLAENPNIINPTLNNTGPFRVWIHESFYDNKPYDRLVTELMRMEGSQRYGGPAGFGVATQNDAPMAAKAHVLGQAFLGLNMKCARCHDAPAHDFLQRDLFSVAAMLKRSPQSVPKSSSIPGFDFESNSLIVEVTLKPGEKVKPNWPFAELVAHDAAASAGNDSREKVAALFTSPRNNRFAQVAVNRLWKRYLGMGLVEPVDDWNGQPALNQELLDYLAYEFVDNGYDVKQTARAIFVSDLYQRKTAVDWNVATSFDGDFQFQSPVLRQMTAEQIVDSLFWVCEKDLNAGPMNIDIDGARDIKNSINLGHPERAWEFASTSNERDRPSLSLPFAQPFVSFLTTFGWRDTRQDPVSERERESTPDRPAVIQNSVLSQRFVRCSDDSAFTRLAVQQQSVEKLVENMTLKVLNRRPTTDENKMFVVLLSPGYDERVVADAKPVERPRLPRNKVSWSNHLDTKANEIKVQLQEAVRRGDPPTNQLTADWRERYEDVLWVLLNSPEFIFVP